MKGDRLMGSIYIIHLPRTPCRFYLHFHLLSFLRETCIYISLCPRRFTYLLATSLKGIMIFYSYLISEFDFHIDITIAISSVEIETRGKGQYIIHTHTQAQLFRKY